MRTCTPTLEAQTASTPHDVCTSESRVNGVRDDVCRFVVTERTLTRYYDRHEDVSITDDDNARAHASQCVSGGKILEKKTPKQKTTIILAIVCRRRPRIGRSENESVSGGIHRVGKKKIQ